MNNYCLTISIYNFKEETRTKVKIDYSLIPVERIIKEDLDDITFKATLSNRIIDNLELKKFKGKEYYQNFSKTKDSCYFTIIMYSDKGIMDFEKENLKDISNYICKKIPFKKTFKDALNKRVERILLTNN